MFSFSQSDMRLQHCQVPTASLEGLHSHAGTQESLVIIVNVLFSLGALGLLHSDCGALDHRFGGGLSGCWDPVHKAKPSL
jgi:hypothetical protein